MFNRKLFFLWLLTIVGSVQCAAAIRTIVVCALGQPQLSASFIVNDGVECEVSSRVILAIRSVTITVIIPFTVMLIGLGRSQS